MASLWYCAIGHGRAEMADAVAAQMRTLEAYSCFDPFTNEPAEQLAEKLLELEPDARRRACSCAASGSEAIDTAMKLARLAHVQAGQPERTLIISRTRGYHGVNYGGTERAGHRPQQDRLRAARRRRRAGAERRHRGARHAHEASAATRSRRCSPSRCRAPAASTRRPTATSRACAGCATSTARYLIFDEVITGFGRLGTLVRRPALRRHARPHHVRQGRDVGLPAARRGVRRTRAARRARVGRDVLPAPRLHVLRPRRPRARPG